MKTALIIVLIIAFLALLISFCRKPKHCSKCSNPISSKCGEFCEAHCKICFIKSCRRQCNYQPEYDYNVDYPFKQCKTCLYRKLNCTQGECMTCDDGSEYVKSLLAEQDGVD
jgi:hypothetical protein